MFISCFGCVIKSKSKAKKMEELPIKTEQKVYGATNDDLVTVKGCYFLFLNGD